MKEAIKRMTNSWEKKFHLKKRVEMSKNMLRVSVEKIIKKKKKKKKNLKSN